MALCQENLLTACQSGIQDISVQVPPGIAKVILLRRCSYGKTKVCTVSAEEFIRRFLQHVLPKGFVKVRYYGLFSPGLRLRLADMREQLNRFRPDEHTPIDREPKANHCPTDERLCPACGQVMQKLKLFPAHVRKPP